jgi:hypothetical protein
MYIEWHFDGKTNLKVFKIVRLYNYLFTGFISSYFRICLNSDIESKVEQYIDWEGGGGIGDL